MKNIAYTVLFLLMISISYNSSAQFDNSNLYASASSSSELEVDIFPYPATPYNLNVEFKQMPEDNAQITVYDVHGNMIMDHKTTTELTNLCENKALDRGKYIIEIKSGSQRIMKRVVIN